MFDTKKAIEDDKKKRDAIEGQFHEDQDILFKEELERDLIDMIKSGMPKSTFVKSCEAMLGINWRLDGFKIMEGEDSSFLEKFKEYCDAD